jgi:hypothetical protein
MRRLIRHVSSQFAHRLVDYSYPQLRPERPRVTGRETHEDAEAEGDATSGTASKEPEEAAAVKE